MLPTTINCDSFIDLVTDADTVHILDQCIFSFKNRAFHYVHDLFSSFRCKQ